MLNNYASCKYVVTKVTVYYSSLVDLSRSRSVHAVEHEPCCLDPLFFSASDCNAVHYGLCSPLLKLPPFVIPPPVSTTPTSPGTPISKPGFTPTSPGTPISKPGSKPSTPTFRLPAVRSKPDNLDFLNPVELLAADLEGKLEALVNSFVAQDKVRLAARQSKEGQRQQQDLKLSTTPSSPSATYPGKNERKLKEDSKHKDDSSSFKVSNKTSNKKQDAHKQKGDKKSDASVTKDVKDAVNKKQAVKNEVKKQETGQIKGPQCVETAVAKVQRSEPIEPKRADVAIEMVTAREQHAVQVIEKILQQETSGRLSPTVPSPKASLEYQQTGVKAQINKFASKEKPTSQQIMTTVIDRKTQASVPTPIVDTVPTLTQTTITRSPITSQSPTAVTNSGQTSLFPVQSTNLTNATNTNLVSASSKESQSPSFIGTFVPTPAQTPIESPVEVTKLRDSAKSRSQRDPRPSSYPSAQYEQRDLLSNLHHRTSSQSLSMADHDLPLSLHISGELDKAGSPRSPKFNNYEHVSSAVDFAKTRFQSTQESTKFEDVFKQKPKNGHVVTDAKHRWETVATSSLCPSPGQFWSNNPYLCEHHMPPEHEADSPRSSSPRKLSSPDLILDGLVPSIPHPKLTNTQRQHIRERSLSPTEKYHTHVPIRPFLTKGSVAERVLLFERCPDRTLERATNTLRAKQVLYNTWKHSINDIQNRMMQGHYDRESLDPSSQNCSLKRVVRSASKATYIPRFYYPHGRPQNASQIDNQLQKIRTAFGTFKDGKGTSNNFGVITKSCGLPLYWKMPLFIAAGGEAKGFVICEDFLEYWKMILSGGRDDATWFIAILTQGGRKYLLPDDFIPMMQDVIDTHPGLTFLKEAIEFHSRYINTVIARIYYCVNRSWSGRITIPELRKSNFLQVVALLEEEEDINQITEYFSYEHFYVIYCKFWELDKDHDLFIDKKDLSRHNDGAMSSRMIDRIFSGAVTRGAMQKDGKMSYSEFVWFLISEEDKRHPRSIEYWFRCMDLDGDGYLSMYELEYFYEEQLQRMESLGIETLPFKDCLCQMLDMIQPETPGKISLADLKKCRMTPIFFDTFFNLEKYLDHEQRDPFASQRDHDSDGVEISDWDRYAAEEYELLVAEEGNAEHQDDLLYDDYDQEEDDLSPNLDKLGDSYHHRAVRVHIEDDEYDYADSDADYNY